MNSPSGSINVFGTETPIKFAKIDGASSGDNVVVAAVTGKSIRVLSGHYICAAAVGVKFQSNTTDLTGLMSYGANGGEVLPFNEGGWFQTIAGEKLDINLSGAVQVSGCISYVEI